MIGSLAMLLFLAGFVCFQLGLGLLTGLFYLVASKVMLLTLVLLALLGLLALCKAVVRDVGAYFNRETAAVRQLLSVRASKQDIETRNAAQWLQLQYLTRFKRQRMLAADNRKQLRELAAAISDELQAVKPQIPVATYKAMSKALRTYRKKADTAAMLALREKLPCR